MTRLSLVLASMVGLASLAVVPAAPVTEEAKAPPAEAAWAKQVSQIAADYLVFGRVDDRARWAPELCRRPGPPQPSLSASKDEETHGRKLYSLFARNRRAYVELAKGSPVGQVIIKESWVPEEVTDANALREEQVRKIRVPAGMSLDNVFGKIDAQDGEKYIVDRFYPYIARDGKTYKAGKPNGLFIMLKLDPTTPNTDNGWVYSTTSADAKSITALGKIDSCMKCHVDAPHDRLFGLPAK